MFNLGLNPPYIFWKCSLWIKDEHMSTLVLLHIFLTFDQQIYECVFKSVSSCTTSSNTVTKFYEGTINIYNY